MLVFALVLGVVTLTAGQRPSFAGTKPIGFPELEKPVNAADASASDLGNRFGEGDATTTTQRLPVEANGDRDLIDRLSKLPVDKQPFWFINWQAIEANRLKPQSWPQRPNNFIDPIPNTGLPSKPSPDRVPALPIPSNSNSVVNPEENSLGNRFGEGDDAKIMTSEEQWRQTYLTDIQKKIEAEYTKL